MLWVRLFKTTIETSILYILISSSVLYYCKSDFPLSVINAFLQSQKVCVAFQTRRHQASFRLWPDRSCLGSMADRLGVRQWSFVVSSSDGFRIGSGVEKMGRNHCYWTNWTFLDLTFCGLSCGRFLPQSSTTRDWSNCWMLPCTARWPEISGGTLWLGRPFF